MVKLLVCVVGIFGISVCLLQLRQERLRLRYEMNRYHNQIEAAQAKLWNQQLKIASVTTPAALARELEAQGGSPGGVKPPTSSAPPASETEGESSEN
jgi:hypothetical protein